MGTLNNTNNKNLRDLLVLFMTDINCFNQIKELSSIKNFVSQVETIKKNLKQYFDKDIAILDTKYIMANSTVILKELTTGGVIGDPIDTNNTENNIINTINNI